MNLSGKLSALGSEEAKYIPIYTLTPYIYIRLKTSRSTERGWRIEVNNE